MTLLDFNVPEIYKLQAGPGPSGTVTSDPAVVNISNLQSTFSIKWTLQAAVKGDAPTIDDDEAVDPTFSVSTSMFNPSISVWLVTITDNTTTVTAKRQAWVQLGWQDQNYRG